MGVIPYSMTQYYSIAVNTPFAGSILPYLSTRLLTPGQLVEVPLGKRKEKGCVLGTLDDLEKIDPKKVKEVGEDYELGFALEKDHLLFLQWVAKYYHYPVGQHIFDVLPKPLKRPREVTFHEGKNLELGYELTKIQKEATSLVKNSIGSFKKILLHGVTGSGKTSVYLEAIKDVLSKGKSVLFLVPEINLTPQFLNLLIAHVPGKILSYHSSISNSQKLRTWQLLNENEGPTVLIGVRSSIFLPLKNLGLIVVDEEHDGSFKQDDRCPYHARDIAIKLCSNMKIPILLGSATPTIESYFAAQSAESSYIRMSERPKNIPLPVIELIDSRVRDQYEKSEEIWPFTLKSLNALNEVVAKGEQALVFVNRLGFASYVQCRSCGQDFSCPNCSTNLKYFKREHALSCQYCDYKEKYPDQCPSCGNLKLLQQGFGTERLEQVLGGFNPELKIGRFDRDAIKNFEQLKTSLNDFEDGKYDILIGTQMLSKGHDFKNVNLVVILGIDSQLNFPDFRSNEKAFQLITQVSGRPGRHSTQGRVLIETLSPENNIFSLVKNYAWKEFFESELIIREALELPPNGRLVALYFSSRFLEHARSASLKAREILDYSIGKKFTDLQAQGPRPAIIEKRANKFTWVLLLKSSNINGLHGALSALERNFKAHHSVSLKIDVDPQNLS
jgi:primosomal protein N' (replication factor Y)